MLTVPFGELRGETGFHYSNNSNKNRNHPTPMEIGNISSVPLPRAQREHRRKDLGNGRDLNVTP